VVGLGVRLIQNNIVKPIVVKKRNELNPLFKVSSIIADNKRIISNNSDLCIYKLENTNVDGRIEMADLGIDIGTKNIVLAYENGNNKVSFIQETNGYYVYPRPSKFVENMLDDSTKVRSDGTKRTAKWIKFEGNPGIYVLGRDAEELAYAHNDTLLRPMADGGVAQDDDAMLVLASIVQGLLEVAEHEIGKFSDNLNICYCTTADALNSSVNVDYHKRVIDLIIDGYETNVNINTSSIKESHAIVLKESPDGTGIGISWGAGTVTVSYVLWGNEIYSFCWVGAGDWIDLEVAKRHGYDIERHRKKSKETPTTVCRAKEKINLSDLPEQRLLLDIALHYRILIKNVITGIVNGFIDNEHEARIDGAINIYMAGGTSSPVGFCDLVKQLVDEESLPFDVNDIVIAENPLYTVASGCLIAAKAQ